MPCPTFFRDFRLAWAAVLVMHAVHGSAQEKLYHFTDEHGVPHFSNQPIDPRYKLVSPAGAAAATPGAATAVDLVAPDQAALGEMFDVTISLANAIPGAGYLELSFDPETLSLQAISVDANLTEPGKVRIDLRLDATQPAQTLASLSFQAVASEPTQASIQVTQLELFKASGEPVPAYAGAWANVRLVQ
jgi:hypothetical protein